jgi:hypothetical protein
MTTVLAEPERQTALNPAQRMRSVMAAARVSVHWFGVRKSLTPQQTAQAADAFGAEDRFLSAAKKLLDTTHPAFKAVTAVRSRLQSYWKGVILGRPVGVYDLSKQAAGVVIDALTNAAGANGSRTR